MGIPRAFHHASAVAALLLLTGCDDVPQTWSRADIEDIAQDQAEDFATDTSGLDSRLTALEAENDALESKASDLESQINTLESANADLEGELSSLQSEYSDHRHY